MYILIYNIFGIWIDSTCESYLVSIRLIYMKMLLSEYKIDLHENVIQWA